MLPAAILGMLHFVQHYCGSSISAAQGWSILKCKIILHFKPKCFRVKLAEGQNRSILGRPLFLDVKKKHRENKAFAMARKSAL